ncbi:Fungal transcriptional regulatory protein [Lodderomyces elongisporus]|uniref:Fungal transcriptional regulatory protein n=1 Tax=Lodderomyces elongisporus TaxID=36914 RepID=UPI00291C99F5|nr:Fungal transcriptional regulatory protein [Lodderomyces elongisporus]WLF79844.1 Fungal transcriptional regulatory protein [Lodderomyces elongisporus]
MPEGGGVVKKQRRKPSNTCDLCKRKKIRCNRQLPCSSCVKINMGYACTYDTKWRPVKTGGSDRSVNSPTALSFQHFNNTGKFQQQPISPSVEPVSTANILLQNSENENRILKQRIAELENLIIHKDKNQQNLDSLASNSTRGSSPTSLKPYIRKSPILPPTHSTFPNPEVGDDEILNFYEGYTSVKVEGNVKRINHGPLSAIALLKRDPALTILWASTCKRGYLKIMDVDRPFLVHSHNADSNKIVHNNVNNFTNNINDTNGENNGSCSTDIRISEKLDNAFKTRYLEVEGYDEYTPYKSRMKKEKIIMQHQKSSSHLEEDMNRLEEDTNMSNILAESQSRMTFTQISIAKTLFDGRVNPELHLIEKIKQILPQKKVFWTLIDLFFSDIYPYVPYVDEVAFRQDLQKLFGPADYTMEPFTKVTFIKKLDLATIAICFVILRLTYYSLYSNRDCVNQAIVNSKADTMKKFLLANPITTTLIDVANSCIYCFDITRKANFTVFQALLFMRVYRNCAFEEGDSIEGSDSQIGTALLVQMAHSLGLNREPDNLDVFHDEKINHLGRKIWYYLVHTDIAHCFNAGYPTSIHPYHFDVVRPFMTDSNSNSKDVAMEAEIVEMFGFLGTHLTLLRRLSNYALDITRGVKMNVINNDLHSLEVLLKTQFDIVQKKRLKDVQHNALELRCMFRVFMGLRTSLISYYYHIYLHYEKKLDSEMAFFYLCKLMHISTYDVMPQVGDVIYGYMSEMALFINPNLQLALSRVNELTLSCLVRVRYNLRAMEQKPQHMEMLKHDVEYKRHHEILKSILQNLNHAGLLLLSLLERLGTRYYYAWRISKAKNVLFQKSTDSGFYDKQNSGLKKIRAFQFTPSQLDYFNSLAKLLADTSARIVNYKDSIENPTPDFSPRVNSQSNFANYTTEPLANTFGTKQEKLGSYISNDNTDGLVDGKSKRVQMNGGASTNSFTAPYESNGAIANSEIANANRDDTDQMWLQLTAMNYGNNYDAVESWMPNLQFLDQALQNSNNQNDEREDGTANGTANGSENKPVANGPENGIASFEEYPYHALERPSLFRDPGSSIYIDQNFDLAYKYKYTYDQIL